MIEKLLEILKDCWGLLTPIVVVHAYQGAAVLRWGVYDRILAPGPHLKWPVAEEAYIEPTCITTMRLLPQTLTTKDDVGVVVTAIVRYQIVDLKPFVTEIFDQKDVLGDTTMGAIRQAVGESSWEELKSNPPETRVAELVRRQVDKFGFKIHKVTFYDIGRVKSLRLIQQAPKDLEN